MFNNDCRLLNGKVLEDAPEDPTRDCKSSISPQVPSVQALCYNVRRA
jgi:hypothetical protein